MAFVQNRVFRVTEACNCCWPSAMSFPGDFVRRFNPQFLDLNSSGHWPVGLPGARERSLSFALKRLGDRVMDSGALVLLQKLTKGVTALSICHTASPLVPTTPSNSKNLTDPTLTQSSSLSCGPPLPVDCRNHVVIWQCVKACVELLHWIQSDGETWSPDLRYRALWTDVFHSKKALMFSYFYCIINLHIFVFL